MFCITRTENSCVLATLIYIKCLHIKIKSTVYLVKQTTIHYSLEEMNAALYQLVKRILLIRNKKKLDSTTTQRGNNCLFPVMKYV